MPVLALLADDAAGDGTDGGVLGWIPHVSLSHANSRTTLTVTAKIAPTEASTKAAPKRRTRPAE